MLRDKIGDCDDLTALFGSLMANLGIETMFLDVFKPGAGHIFVMFDSGINLMMLENIFLMKMKL